LLHYSRSIP